MKMTVIEIIIMTGVFLAYTWSLDERLCTQSILSIPYERRKDATAGQLDFAQWNSPCPKAKCFLLLCIIVLIYKQHKQVNTYHTKINLILNFLNFLLLSIHHINYDIVQTYHMVDAAGVLSHQIHVHFLESKHFILDDRRINLACRRKSSMRLLLGPLHWRAHSVAIF